MITFESVTLRRSARFALEDFSLRVEPGRVTALIGPSGCGKSTALRLAAGLLQPEGGQISFDGRSLDYSDSRRVRNGWEGRKTGRARAGADNSLVTGVPSVAKGTPPPPIRLRDLRLRTGFVLQEGGLFPHMSVYDNITLMARYLNWPATHIEQRLQELLPLTHLPADLLRSRPTQLSGGERQRVSILRALMLDPEVLLLDEPLGALDPLVRYGLQTELKALFQQLAKSVVIVTHDIGEAAYLGHTLVLMNEGRIVQRGEFAELVQKPYSPFVSEFISASRPPPRLPDEPRH